ncbi:MAG: DUF6785 family protein, partial [Planctomycetota bacterium]
MTLRAFIIGLLAVAALCLVDPYTSFHKGYAWNTAGHFPQGAVFLLICFTIGLNLLLRLIRRSWTLKQAELMLIWCMLIVAAITPSGGLHMHFLGVPAGPPYLAGRADVLWRETAFAATPEALVLSKDPRSEAARQYFEGAAEGGRIPWEKWQRPLGHWILFMAFFFGSMFFLGGILRKQWVQRERLQFPVARVPLEFTEGSGGQSLWGLPTIFANRAFVGGLIVAAAFRLMRAVPLFFGAQQAWNIPLPLKDAFLDTPFEQLYLENISVNWLAIGFAYLVPADVSLSVWFFYLFGRGELKTASVMGSSLQQGELMQWQMSASYVVFTLGVLFMARRHLTDVVRKAIGLGRKIDDSAEPVAYGLGFWGFMVCCVGMVGWLAYHGMKAWVGVALLFGWICIMVVHARLVAQSGLYLTDIRVQGAQIVHGLSGGRAFSPAGAVIAQMQDGAMLLGNISFLSPQVFNAFRIGEVFQKRRRLLLPALGAALVLALAAST